MASTVRSLSGPEFFDRWSAGDIVPPIAAALDFDLLDHADGEVTIGCDPREFHYSPYGMLHGGVISTLLDTAAGCAVHSKLDAGHGYATINLEVSFLRPVTVESGSLTCEGRVISFGRRVAVSQAILLDETRVELARGTAHSLVLRP